MARKIRVKKGDEQKTVRGSRSGTHSTDRSVKLREGVVSRLQRQYGNTTVQRMVASGMLRAKLNIGKPGDKYEREADTVADRVMNMPEPRIGRQADPEAGILTRPLADRISPLAQRQIEEEEKVQSQPEEDQEPAQAKFLQRQAAEEEEPVQAKFLQRQTAEEEEPVQAKFLQRQAAEEEEPAQAKFLQRQEEEEEAAQAKFLQRQEEEEEPVRAKFIQGQEEEELQPQTEEEEAPVQAKSNNSKADRSSPAIESGIQSIRGGGRQLAESTRSFFEPRFGADFSGVKVHTDATANHLARSIKAKAFTVGRDVVFGSGQYSPDSSRGKQLLAHELTHVVQQKKETSVQRKIKTNQVALDKYFPAGLPNVKKSNSTYSITSGASYISLKKQIVSDLLLSPRVFKIKGNNLLETAINFINHVNDRKGIVKFASKKKYQFGAGTAFKMNPEYWVKVNNKWRVKPGKNSKEAYEDVNKNPQKYSIACHAATVITMLAGSGFSDLTKDRGVDDQDWVPGDWGYIKNTNFRGSPVGQEGENLINVSPNKFWGHLSKTNTYRSIGGWMNKVKAWHGAAKLLKWRKRPKRGLEN